MPTTDSAHATAPAASSAAATSPAAAGSVAAVTTLPGIAITIDGALARSETTVAVAAANVVVLTTALAEHAVTVTSSYVGHQAVATHVTHLILTPQRSYVASAQHPHAEVPVTHARERCVLEHATVLQDATAGRVDVSDRALLAATEL